MSHRLFIKSIHFWILPQLLTKNLIFQFKIFSIKKAVRNLTAFFGSPNWARTSDIMINSHALYRLSYGGIYNFIWFLPRIFVKIAQTTITTLFFFPLLIIKINKNKRKEQITNQSVMKCNLKVRNLCDFGEVIILIT